MAWDLQLGDVDSRTSLQDRHGGSRSRGISAPAMGGPNHDIMLWWRPERGEHYGYVDGCAPDGSAFYYTGTGQEGDQEFDAPLIENGRVRDHVQNGDRDRLLRYVGSNSVRYLGELQLDPTDPWRWVDGPDRFGIQRKMIQFRFLPQGSVLLDPVGPIHPEPTPAIEPTETFPEPPSPTQSELERIQSHEYEQLRRLQTVLLNRKGARLVHRFAAWLQQLMV